MSESGQRSTVCKTLKSLDARAVENRVGPGTPDVNYAEGWIELKWMRRWPENCDESPVLLPHYTQQQRVWHKLRWRKGGHVYVLLQVAREWLLFDGDIAAEHVGRVNRQELITFARHYWPKGLNKTELIRCLTTSRS